MKPKLPSGHGLNIPHQIRTRKPLKAARDKLAARLLASDPQRSHPDARARANSKAEAHLAELVEARLAEHVTHRTGKVGAHLDRIAEIQGDVIGGLSGVLGDASAKKLTPRALVTALRNLRAEMRALRKAMKDPVGPSPAGKPETSALLTEIEGTVKTVKVKAPLAAGTARLVKHDFRPVAGTTRWRKKYRGGVVEIEVNAHGLFEVTSKGVNDVTPVKFAEFDTLRDAYRNKPLASPVMQAHHGCQDALMKDVFGEFYDKHSAPTIWLRDSSGDSPHGMITNALQKPRTVKSLTYADIRRFAIEDLAAIGCPPAKIADYISVIDAYVKTMVENGAPRKLVGNVTGI